VEISLNSNLRAKTVSLQDSAFLDRVDVKQFIPEPSSPAAYTIMRSCIIELQRCGIISRQPRLEGENGFMTEDNDHPQVPPHNIAVLTDSDTLAIGTKLLKIAGHCKVCGNPLLILYLEISELMLPGM
jgi:hypothetical protein